MGPFRIESTPGALSSPTAVAGRHDQAVSPASGRRETGAVAKDREPGASGRQTDRGRDAAHSDPLSDFFTYRSLGILSCTLDDADTATQAATNQ